MAGRIGVALALVWSLGACVYHVDSAIPDSLATFEPGLIGTWTSESDTAVISDGQDSTYRITYRDSDGDSMRFHARTGRLGDRTVLEITPVLGDEDDDWPVGRMLLVVNVAGNVARTWIPDTDSLRARVASGSAAMPHIIRGNDIILTAPTAQLAPAMREYLRRPGALTEEAVWRRAVRRSRDVRLATPNGEMIAADLYGGAGDHGIVIIGHGGYSTRESWGSVADTLARAGFRVLVVESRAAAALATGRESPCLYDEVCQAVDVLAGVRYLRREGARTVSVMGGSMGGAAVAQASVDAAPGEIDRVVLLAPADIASPGKMKGRTLVITTRDDANTAGLRLPGIRAQYDQTPEPKRFILLDGSAHAQRIFLTEHRDRVLRDILEFLRTR